ncbi:MAG: S9 family peptidase [Desulfurococcales archaeon]|nr:S9 family peptidase [Desulfurococcales archaeon]
MHKYSKVIEDVLELVSIELYGLTGVASGDRLVVTALREGSLNVYSFDGDRLVKLNRDPINFIAIPPYGAQRVIIGRDVARGREQHLLFYINIDEPGVEVRLSKEQEPMRIFGIADDGSRAVFTGATAKDISVYLIDKGGSTSRVASLPGIGSVVRLKGDLAAGIGVFQGDPTRFQLFLVDIESGDVKIHNPPGGSATWPTFTSEGQLIYGLEGAEYSRLMVLDLETLKAEPLKLLHDDLEAYKPRAFNYIDYTPEGELIVVARREGRSKLFIDGREVETPEGILSLAFKLGDKIVVSHTSLSTPPRVIEVGVDGGWRTLIEGEKPEWLSDAIGGGGFEWVESFDGSRVPVFVLYSGRAPKPGPAVVLVHGGPFAEDMDAWDIFASALATAGFHVIMPNYRGSTGYGEEWRVKIIGDPCGAELEDIASTARWALENGIASRVYIMGYSYGGYMTMCSLVKKPGLYKAGVAGASVVDWNMMYELSDAAFKQFIEVLFAGKRELWGERSPINYVENMKDPLCIIHPQNDTRTPLKPVLKFMERALEQGKSFEAHIAPDMGHTVNTVDDAIKLLLPAILFLTRMEDKGKEQ